MKGWINRNAARPLRSFASSERATATVEFAIALPLVLTILVSAVDFGVVMIRQTFLERAVEMAVRQIRLGLVQNVDFESFRAEICSGTALLPDCEASITVEPLIIDTTTFANLNTPVQCVNRAEDITPQIEFTTGSGAQELMMLRVCAVADPFFGFTSMALGMQRNSSGDYVVVTRSVFVNEPSA